IPLWAAVDGSLTAVVAVIGGSLLTTCFLIPKKSLHCAVAVLSASLLLLALAAAGHAASILATGSHTTSRISLGPAFWILGGCAVLAVVDALQRLAAGIAAQVLATIAIAAGVVALATAGNFDAL